MTYFSEKYQLGILEDYFRTESIQYDTEFELYSIPIDIVALNDTDVITIELKSKDFSRGIRQANRNCDFADYSYLAMWSSNISEALIERADNTEIGLIAIDGDVKFVSPAERNAPNEYVCNRIREHLKE